MRSRYRERPPRTDETDGRPGARASVDWIPAAGEERDAEYAYRGETVAVNDKWKRQLPRFCQSCLGVHFPPSLFAILFHRNDDLPFGVRLFKIPERFSGSA